MRKKHTCWPLPILGLTIVAIRQVTINGRVLVDILMDLNMALNKALFACQRGIYIGSVSDFNVIQLQFVLRKGL